jgi:hypothetical protein
MGTLADQFFLFSFFLQILSAVEAFLDRIPVDDCREASICFVRLSR